MQQPKCHPILRTIFMDSLSHLIPIATRHQQHIPQFSLQCVFWKKTNRELTLIRQFWPWNDWWINLKILNAIEWIVIERACQWVGVFDWFPLTSSINGFAHGYVMTNQTNHISIFGVEFIKFNQMECAQGTFHVYRCRRRRHFGHSSNKINVNIERAIEYS